MKSQRLQFIETKVSDLLEESGIFQAPVDVEKIARNLNIAIKRTPSEDDISGFLLVQANDQVVIGVNMLHHPNRQRFTIAHEIGHFMLHEIDDVHVDRAVVKLRDQRSSSGINTDEVEANRFAAELLMPTEFLDDDMDKFLLNDLHDDRRMMQLAKRYQVSVQAMTNRVVSLGLVPELIVSRRRI